MPIKNISNANIIDASRYIRGECSFSESISVSHSAAIFIGVRSNLEVFIDRMLSASDWATEHAMWNEWISISYQIINAVCHTFGSHGNFSTGMRLIYFSSTKSTEFCQHFNCDHERILYGNHFFHEKSRRCRSQRQKKCAQNQFKDRMLFIYSTLRCENEKKHTVHAVLERTLECWSHPKQ